MYITWTIIQRTKKNEKQEATLSVKQSVTPAKQEATLSVKQSVTQDTVNVKESFTRTHTNTACNKNKIRLNPILSPEGCTKKLQPHKRKFFFQLSTDEKEKTGTEIELCDTFPDLDDKNENKVGGTV